MMDITDQDVRCMLVVSLSIQSLLLIMKIIATWFARMEENATLDQTPKTMTMLS